MSDTPPPELVDRLVPQVLRVAYGAVDHSPTERILRKRIKRDMPHILAALAEWADGGLIDPSTWTVVKVQEVEGIGYCRTHDEADIEGYDAMGDCRPDPSGCMSTPLYTLSPVPSKETP